MTHRNRHTHSVHSLVVWAFWSLLAVLCGLTFTVDGSHISRYPITHEGSAGPPAIQGSMPPHTHSTGATTLTGSPSPSGHVSEGYPDFDDYQFPTKPVSLEFLTEQLQSVRSPSDLIQIFADGQTTSHAKQTARVVRTPRSAVPANRQIQMVKERLATHHPEIQWSDFIAQNPSYIEALRRQGADLSELYDETEDYPADEPNYEAFEAAIHHMDEMNSCSSHQCKDPKPFVHLMRDPRHRNRVFIPQCTILHRCMNFTGCCGDSGRECAPKRMAVIFRAFIVVDRVTGHEGLVEFNPSMAAMIPLINHTECECKEKPRLPECTKKCPAPFRLMREAHNCTCNCFGKAHEDHPQCDGVKEGIAQLSQDGLVCIKMGLCYSPECVSGTFDVKRGYCPLSDQHSLPAYLFENTEDRRHHRKHLKYIDYRASRSWSRTRSRPRSTSRRSRLRPRPSSSRSTTVGNVKRHSLSKTVKPTSLSHVRSSQNSNRKQSSHTSTATTLNIPESSSENPNVRRNRIQSQRKRRLPENSQVPRTSTHKRHRPVITTHEPPANSNLRPPAFSTINSQMPFSNRPHMSTASTVNPSSLKTSQFSAPNSSTDEPPFTESPAENLSSPTAVNISSTTGALSKKPGAPNNSTQSPVLLQTLESNMLDNVVETSKSDHSETTEALRPKNFSNSTSSSSSSQKSKNSSKRLGLKPHEVKHNITSIKASQSHPPGIPAKNLTVSLNDSRSTQRPHGKYREKGGHLKSSNRTSSPSASLKHSQPPMESHQTFAPTPFVQPKLQGIDSKQTREFNYNEENMSNEQNTASTPDEMDRFTSVGTSQSIQRSNLVSPQPTKNHPMPQDMPSLHKDTGLYKIHRGRSSMGKFMSSPEELMSKTTDRAHSETSDHAFKGEVTIEAPMYIDDKPDVEDDSDLMEGSGENNDSED